MQTFTKDLREKEYLLFQLQQEKIKQQEHVERLSKQLVEVHGELSDVTQAYQSYKNSMQDLIQKKRAEFEQWKVASKPN
jgi:non-homologous end joining protein Ku